LKFFDRLPHFSFCSYYLTHPLLVSGYKYADRQNNTQVRGIEKGSVSGSGSEYSELGMSGLLHGEFQKDFVTRVL